MKLFIKNLKKYWKYTIYAVKAELNAEVSDSYLGALWWLLDPICFMLIYTFVTTFVFGAKEDYFPVFCFIGLTTWNFFNKTISQSVTLVRQNKGVVTKVYVPKYILVLEKMGVFLFKMFIAYILVFIMMVLYGVPVTWLAFVYFIPITAVLITLTFGGACILMHYGVFVEDLAYVTDILLKLVFYLSGIFYSITIRLEGQKLIADILLKLNPIAFLMQQYRNVLLYSTPADLVWLGIWFAIGLAVSLVGIHLIRKYENSYAKVV
jgi:ABC-type polysaccharide/polyol phosphate export systems, permease component